MVAAFSFLIVDYGHGAFGGGQLPGRLGSASPSSSRITSGFVFEGVQNRIIAADLIRRALLAGKRV